MSFLPLYLSVHLNSLHRQTDSPYFLHFHPGFLHIYSCWFPAFPPHSSHSSYFVPQFPISTFTDSLLSLQFLRISFKKIVTLVKKRAPLLIFQKEVEGFLRAGKLQRLHLFLSLEVVYYRKTIDQFRYCRLFRNFSRKLRNKLWKIILKIKTSYPKTNMDSERNTQLRQLWYISAI